MCPLFGSPLCRLAFECSCLAISRFAKEIINTVHTPGCPLFAKVRGFLLVQTSSGFDNTKETRGKVWIRENDSAACGWILIVTLALKTEVGTLAGLVTTRYVAKTGQTMGSFPLSAENRAEPERGPEMLQDMLGDTLLTGEYQNIPQFASTASATSDLDA